MDLNNIQLSPGLTAALYRSSLIENGSTEAVEEASIPGPPATQAWKYLGDNKKNILLVVNYSRTTHLPDEDLNFLTSVLSACKLSLGDVAIVNTNNFPGHTYKDYTVQFKSKTILLFGTDPGSFGLPLDFPHFQVQSFSNCTFLYTPPLNEFDKLLKSKLWVCLQRIFGI